MVDFNLYKVAAFLFVILAVCLFLYVMLIHETIYPFNPFMRKRALNQGFYHYTTIENAKKIIKSGELKGNMDKKSIFKRKPMVVWLVFASNGYICKYYRKKVIKRHCPYSPTGLDKSIKYETKLLITGIKKTHLDKMRHSLELAVGFYGRTLKDVKIEAAELDDIDRLLGIKKLNFE